MLNSWRKQLHLPSRYLKALGQNRTAFGTTNYFIKLDNNSISIGRRLTPQHDNATAIFYRGYGVLLEFV